MSDTELDQEVGLPEEPPAEASAPQEENSIFPLYPDPQIEEALTAGEAPPADSAPVSTAVLEGSDGMVPPPPPEGPKRDKRKVFRIAAIAVAAVVVLCATAAFAVPAILQAVNPKAYLSACLAKTTGAYSVGGDAAAVLAGIGSGPSRTEFYFQMGAPDVGTDSELTNEINEKYGPDAPLPDLRYTAALELDHAGRRADLELSLSYMGNAISLLAMANDNLVSFGSDDLTGGDYYCINTETLGADVAASPVFGELFDLDPAYGFNLFDASLEKGASNLDPDTLSLLKQFYDELDKAVTVEKSGSPTVTVLGHESASTRYVMTVPGEALRSFVVQSLRALTEDEAFLSAADFTAITPEEFIGTMDQIFSTIKDAVTIEFYIAGGQVILMDAELPMELDGQTATTNLTIEFDKGGNALVASLTAADEDSAPGRLVLSYTRDGENFDLTLVITDGEEPAGDIHIVGSFTADKAAKTFTLDISELSFTSEEETRTFGMGLTSAPLDGFSHELPTAPTPLLEMDQEAFYGLLLQALYGASSVFNGDAGVS